MTLRRALLLSLLAVVSWFLAQLATTMALMGRCLVEEAQVTGVGSIWCRRMDEIIVAVALAIFAVLVTLVWRRERT